MTIRMVFALAGFAVFAVIWWASAPPTVVAFDKTCEPKGMKAVLSSFLSPYDFWRKQRDAAHVEQAKLEHRPESFALVRAEIRNFIRSFEAEVRRIYQQHPNLTSDSPAQQTVRIPENAEIIERAEWEELLEHHRLRRIVVLRKCEQEFNRQLAPLAL